MKNPLDCLANLFKKPTPPYDYGAALARIAAQCQKSTAYSLVFWGLYYDATKGKYCIHFECAEKEYTQGRTRKKYYYSTRRDEKLFGDNLEDLLDYAITYTGYPDAFMVNPKDNLPEGITMNIKNIARVPGAFTPSLPKWKLK